MDPEYPKQILKRRMKLESSVLILKLTKKLQYSGLSGASRKGEIEFSGIESLEVKSFYLWPIDFQRGC